MYLLRAKKNFESKDEQELQEKRENYKVRQKKARQIQAGGRTSSILFNTSEANKSPLNFNVDKDELTELPDGSVHKNSIKTADENAQLRPAGYIGTFSVQSTNPAERTEFVNKQLKQMQTKFHKNVVISISLSGVKVFTSDGKNLVMGHALHRISYASCNPECNQFSFLAREPRGKVNVQFCHAFVTSTPQQAEELNLILGNAFKIAHIDQREEDKPSFNEVIKKQLDEQKAQFKEYQARAEQTLQKNLKTISTPTPFCEKAMERMENRRSAHPSKFTAFQNLPERQTSLIQKPSKTSYVSPFRSYKDMDDFRMDKSHQRAASIKTAVQTSLQNLQHNHNNNRTRGSPVVALKDSIDQQFENTQFENTYTNTSHSATVDAMDGSTYLAPVCNHPSHHHTRHAGMTATAPPQQDVSDHSKTPGVVTNMASRPLPAIPFDTERPLRLPPQQRSSSRIATSKSPETSPNLNQSRKVVKHPRHSAQPYRKSASCDYVGQPRGDGIGAGSWHNIVSHTRSADAVPIVWPLRASKVYAIDAANNDADAVAAETAAGTIAEQPACDDRSQDTEELSADSQTDVMEFSDVIGTGQFDNIDPRVSRFCSQSSSPRLSGSDLGDTRESPRSSNDSDHASSSPRSTRTDNITECNDSNTSLDDSGSVQSGRPSVDSPVDLSTYQINEPPLYSLDDLGLPDAFSQPTGRRPMSYPVSELSSANAACSDSAVSAIATMSRCHIRYQNDSDSESVDSGYEVPLSPGRLDSLRKLDRSYIEDESLRQCSWYQPGIPRHIALEILQAEDPGCFIVRNSSTHPGCYALSVNVPKYNNPSGIAHYLIVRTPLGVKLKGLNKDWSSLVALVTHHTVMPEMLPCTLHLPHTSHNPSYHATDRDVRDEDPDYQRPSDLESLMASLEAS